MSSDDIIRLLDELGQRLGPTGEYVFRLAVQRAVIGGVMSTITGVILILIPVLSAVPLWRYVTEPDQDIYSSRDIVGVLAGFLGLFVLAFGLFCLYSGVITLLTPEYTALRDILSAIGAGR